MLKTFGAFLLTFCVLSFLVRTSGLGELFGSIALLLFAIDVLLSRYERDRRHSRYRATVL